MRPPPAIAFVAKNAELIRSCIAWQYNTTASGGSQTKGVRCVGGGRWGWDRQERWISSSRFLARGSEACPAFLIVCLLAYAWCAGGIIYWGLGILFVVTAV
jgi:hypothetical protein